MYQTISRSTAEFLLNSTCRWNLSTNSSRLPLLCGWLYLRSNRRLLLSLRQSLRDAEQLFDTFLFTIILKRVFSITIFVPFISVESCSIYRKTLAFSFDSLNLIQGNDQLSLFGSVEHDRNFHKLNPAIQ